MQSKKTSFINRRGLQLSAMLALPDSGNAQAYALFAHCFTCSKNLKAVMSISRTLTARQIAIFRFDFSGLGDSEGEFSETGYQTILMIWMMLLI
ncbi:MAG: hypothetical protein Q9M30_06760 [Mariprofundaceae bacterium]|nr:hypothetical protein [Mariprofundaceae bacterium]